MPCLSDSQLEKLWQIHIWPNVPESALNTEMSRGINSRISYINTGVGSSIGWSASYDDREVVVQTCLPHLAVGGKTLPGFLADCVLSIQSAVSLGKRW